MAKKTKKKTTKKAPSKPARSASKKTTKKSTKKTTKKTVKKSAKKTTKKTVKKAAAKKTTKKKTTKKKPVKKSVTKKSTAKKSTTKKTSKKSTPATKKTTSKKAATTKKSTKKAPAKSAAKAESDPKESGAASKDKPADSKRTNRRRSNKPKAALVFPERPMLGSLKNMKPLIASGSAVKKEKSVLDAEKPKKIKSPFNKRQLDGYKAILLAKRDELLGDIKHLEDEALKSGTGDSAHTTNHISEQGSDNYDQALNLNLAAADRKMLAEIDDALQRIADRTYGACMITGEPIKKARLDELPWAKYSIKAAQELDRRGY